MKKEVEMKLSFLMAVLFRIFQVSAFISPPFRRKVREKEVRLVMKSADNKVSRTFLFERGKIRSKRGEIPDSGCRLIWKRPGVGAKIMVEIASGRPKAIEGAIIRGHLMLEGDAVSIKWFLETIQMLRSIYLGKRVKKAA